MELWPPKWHYELDEGAPYTRAREHKIISASINKHLAKNLNYYLLLLHYLIMQSTELYFAKHPHRTS